MNEHDSMPDAGRKLKELKRLQSADQSVQLELCLSITKAIHSATVYQFRKQPSRDADDALRRILDFAHTLPGK